MQMYLSSFGIKIPCIEHADDLYKLQQNIRPHSDTFKITAPELLPRAEKRRSSESVRIALDVAQQALSRELSVALEPDAIFASAYGDPVVTHKLCDMLAQSPPMASPTLFHNSVHNAPAGYWNISTGLHTNSNSIAAGEHTFANALLLAASRCQVDKNNVLLVCYDLPYGDPLRQKCHVHSPFAVAFLFTPKKLGHSKYSLNINVANNQNITTMLHPEWEKVRTGNPAARSLPLLAALQEKQDTSINIELGDKQQLQIQLAHAF